MKTGIWLTIIAVTATSAITLWWLYDDPILRRLPPGTQLIQVHTYSQPGRPTHAMRIYKVLRNQSRKEPNDLALEISGVMEVDHNQHYRFLIGTSTLSPLDSFKHDLLKRLRHKPYILPAEAESKVQSKDFDSVRFMFR